MILSLPACEQAGGGEAAAEINLDSVKAEIQALEDGYAAAMNANNVDGVMTYYAEDAQSLGDDEPTRVGKAAIRASIEAGMASDTLGYTVSYAVTDVWACGDMAVETGTSTVKNKDGNVVETGKYMVLFEKRDGKYVAIREMYNEDADDDDDEAEGDDAEE